MIFRKRSPHKIKKSLAINSEVQTDPPADVLSKSVEQNLQKIQETLGNSTDLIIRKIPYAPAGGRTVAILFTDGLAEGKVVNDYIMESLMQKEEGDDSDPIDRESDSSSDIFQTLKDEALTFGDIRDLSNFEALYHSLLSGDAIILIDGESKGIAASARGWRDRGVGEPAVENVVRGPREGFSEVLRTNTALIRRKIKDPRLWLESKQIGRVTQTDIGIMYIKGIANDKIVEEVHARLDRIDIDSILESGYIEELIQDETMTPFPTVYNSERPDVIAAELLEGKVAILVDGTPFVLMVPAPFVSFMNAAEDYYQRADISSFVRLLRYGGAFIALLAPSLYIAITTFHQEMLPTSLLIGLAAQRENVPFPAFIEALMMEVTFEILREAGVRMPKYIGAAVSIVGTLVIGQAAVEAGIISAAMVIVVSITAISSFVLPAYNMSIAFRMMRFPFMGLAASFGLYGIFVGCIALVLHLCSLRTFGVPYMAPLAPLIPSDNKDALFRFPHSLLLTRPRLTNQKNIKRENSATSRKSQK
ncbi:spore germination protein [Paenibacillus sp. N3/727]|uniref:spore germination protein n=1 Tax=Paenibacillus sp. N3/727 TaxID=2925845 RepID=UPI001F52F3B1|nr:spore germination protein [Paenibacillus sp. N3/727]UNK16848.1 spore germination protein [Paenibacillus sp. N3/727]